MAIFRVIKDSNNPYIVINKRFIEDENLSLKAKGLMSYFLSKPDDWQFYTEEIKKHTTDKDRAITAAINELLEQGYIKRTRRRSGGKFLGGYDYDVFENPTKENEEVKEKPIIDSTETLKCQSGEMPDWENAESAKCRTGKTPNWQKRGLLYNDYKLNNDFKLSNDIYMSDSKEYGLAEYLFSCIKKNNSKAKEPNYQKWAKVFDYIIRIDKREVDEVQRIIKFSQEDSFWYKNILSPDSLRKHYDRLLLQMNDKSGTGKKQNNKAGNFGDYNQREYDFDELERKLLGWDK